MTLNEINKSYENIPDSVEEQFQQIIENVKKWIEYVSEGYDEIIIQSDHYPFSYDSPVTIWIRKSHPETPFMLYSKDWDLFKVRSYPNIACIGQGKDFIEIDYKAKGNLDPFEYLRNYWDDDWDTADSINKLIDQEFDKETYIVDIPELPEAGLTGSDTGKKPQHQVTDTTHLCVGNNYDGDVYLDLYVVARRIREEVKDEL